MPNIDLSIYARKEFKIGWFYRRLVVPMIEIMSRSEDKVSGNENSWSYASTFPKDIEGECSYAHVHDVCKLLA
jgi:hypothetical protein